MSFFKGMIFDFNGVLFWDSDLQTRSWREFSVRLRGTPLSDEEMVEHVHGRIGRYTFEYLLGRPLEDAEELSAFSLGKEDIYRRLCLESGARFKLSPGAEGLLDELAAKDVPRTIATAMEMTNVDFFMKHFNLEKWFMRSKIVYDDGSLPGKPDPGVYLKAAWNLGLKPAECVVAEDSRSGLAAASAAGIGRVVALGPEETHPLLLGLPGVSCAVENLGQLDVKALFGR